MEEQNDRGATPQNGQQGQPTPPNNGYNGQQGQPTPLNNGYNGQQGQPTPPNSGYGGQQGQATPPNSGYNGAYQNGQYNGYNGQYGAYQNGQYNGQYNGYNGQPPYYPPQPAQTPLSTLSIVGFVFAFVMSLVGLILSIVAYNNAKNENDLRSQNFSRTGIILSAVFLGLSVLFGVIVGVYAAEYFQMMFGAYA